MRMLSLVSLMVLVATIFSLSAKGDEPPTPKTRVQSQDVKLPPEIQATLAQLLKTLSSEQASGGSGGSGSTADANPMAPMISQLLKMLNSAGGQDGNGGQGGNHGGGVGSGNVDVSKIVPIFAQMLKMLDMDAADEPSSNVQKTQEEGLHTGSLTTHSLGGAHMSDAQWRELFPKRH